MKPFKTVIEALRYQRRVDAARRKARKTALKKRVDSVPESLSVSESLEWLEANPVRCTDCRRTENQVGGSRKMHLHHPNGYGPGSEHGVMPLCASCHRKRHARGTR